MASCSGVKTVAVRKSYKLKSVTFGGNRYYPVRRDSGEFYETPHWQDDPGRNFPVAFVRNSVMELEASFEIKPAPKPGTVIKIRGFGLDGQNVPETQISGGGTNIATLPMAPLSAPLPATVAYFNPFVIDWELNVGNEGWIAVGQSRNIVYVTLATPRNPSSLYRTVLDLATTSGNPADDPAAVSATWARFAALNVRTWDQRPLHYYKPGLDFGTTCAVDSGELLADPFGSGQCRSFAVLLQDAFAANGIPSDISNVRAPGFNLVVKNWSPLGETIGDPLYKWSL